MGPFAVHLYATEWTPISKLVLSCGVPEIGSKLRNEHVAWFLLIARSIKEYGMGHATYFLIFVSSNQYFCKLICELCKI
jgi:hypothetical protein